MLSPSGLGLPTPPSPLTATRAAAGEERLRSGPPDEVAQQLESVFLSMLLKQLRQSVSEEGLFPGDTSDTFGGMFDQYLGDHLAAAGGLGIAALLAPSAPSTPGSPAAPTTHPQTHPQEAYRHVLDTTQ